MYADDTPVQVVIYFSPARQGQACKVTKGCYASSLQILNKGFTDWIQVRAVCSWLFDGESCTPHTADLALCK